MDELLQPIWNAMMERDKDNIFRVVLTGPPPSDGSPIIYHPAVIARRSAHPDTFDHLVIESPPQWQSSLYSSLKNEAITLDPRQYSNGYRSTLGLISLPQEVSGLDRRTLSRELRCQPDAAIGSCSVDKEENEEEEEEKKELPTTRSPTASASDFILAVFSYIEQQWLHWTDPTHHPKPPPPPISRKLYMHNLSPSDLRDGADALKRKSKQDEEDEDSEMDDRGDNDDSFFLPSSLCKSSLCQDHFISDPRSLHHLLTEAGGANCPGLFESLLYFKCGPTCFFMHQEQLYLGFTHHQMSGDSLWIVIEAGQRTKLRLLVYRMALARMKSLNRSVDESQFNAKQIQNLKDVSWILFLAKMLFPPLSLLNEHGIIWHPQFIQAGRVITGDGDAVHFGFSISDAQTVSFARNQFDVDYLYTGPEKVLVHYEWVARIDALHKADELEEYMDQLAIDPDWLRLALNIAPAELTCVLFSELLKDLTDKNSSHAMEENEPGSYHVYSEEHLDKLRGKNGIIEKILNKLHASTNLLNKHYKDTTEGGRNLTLCSHANQSELEE